MILPYPIRFLADEHRMDGQPDDFFIRCNVAYEKYRQLHPDGSYIHGGDTFDTARAEVEDIKKQWSYLNVMEENDVFLLGNHEVKMERLQSIAPGLCLTNIEVNGYLLEHGNRLFKATATVYENTLIAMLLYVHRKTDRRWKWVEDKIEGLYAGHRSNEVAYEAYEKEGTMKSCFGHSHIKGNYKDWWNPGALWKDFTILIFDNPQTGPRFEPII